MERLFLTTEIPFFNIITFQNVILKASLQEIQSQNDKE